jgi:nucleotide-binding universal stress UspA family protein
MIATKKMVATAKEGHAEHILVGVDSEPPSMLAARWAALRAARHGSSIELVTAIDGLAADPLDTADHLKAVTAMVHEVAPHVQVTTDEVEGSIRNVLMRLAETADLLVVGFHRSRPIRSALSGSVALGLAAESAVPTVVVPEDWDESTAHGPVLVGMELDGSSDAAMEFAANEARDGRELHVLHAWRLPPVPVDALEALVIDRPRDVAWHRTLLAQAADRVRAGFQGVVVHEQLRESFPARALIEGGVRASMIVMGSHGRGTIGSLVLGSTTRAVMHNSSTPVCVVPGPDRRVSPAEVEHADQGV